MEMASRKARRDIATECGGVEPGAIVRMSVQTGGSQLPVAVFGGEHHLEHFTGPASFSEFDRTLLLQPLRDERASSTKRKKFLGLGRAEPAFQGSVYRV